MHNETILISQGLTELTDTQTLHRHDISHTTVEQRVADLRVAWKLYEQWKTHYRRWQENQDAFGRTDLEAQAQLKLLLGDTAELEQAGQICGDSIAAHLKSLEGVELSEVDRTQVNQIRLQWEREQELLALRTHDRDIPERDR